MTKTKKNAHTQTPILATCIPYAIQIEPVEPIEHIHDTTHLRNVTIIAVNACTPIDTNINVVNLFKYHIFYGKANTPKSRNQNCNLRIELREYIK